MAYSTLHIKKSGFTLIEEIIYVAILALIFTVVVTTLLSFSSSYRKLSALRSIEHSATESLERITRDARSASSVDILNSTLGTSPGVLALTTTQKNISTTTKFYIQDDILRVDINSEFFGPLTTADTKVTSLIFHELTSTSSQAVKIDMTVEATRGPVTESRTYHTTVVLKQS